MDNELYGDEALIHIMTILEEEEREKEKKVRFGDAIDIPYDVISEKRGD
ncbi:MAG: hypothetical protein FWH57_04710 [Oscillospiraceae bacterium]|nr:hypothetical protein [Oscillospiraceae bacterium]